MKLKILCTPTFSKREGAALDIIANALGVTREEVVRRAVRDYSRKCVPTHFDKTIATR